MQLVKGLVFVRPIDVEHFFLRYIAQQRMKKLFSIVSELPTKGFAEHHSDWPKLLFGSQALVVGHRNSKCVLFHIQTVCQ